MLRQCSPCHLEMPFAHWPSTHASIPQAQGVPGRSRQTTCIAPHYVLTTQRRHHLTCCTVLSGTNGTSRCSQPAGRRWVNHLVLQQTHWACMAWHDMAGTARHGTARHGTARHGTARHGRHGKARHGTARHGTAWLAGMARHAQRCNNLCQVLCYSWPLQLT
jgi:hypothetical protein